MKYRIQSVKLDGLYTEKDLWEIRRGMGMTLNSVSLPQISPVSELWGAKGHQIPESGQNG